MQEFIEHYEMHGSMIDACETWATDDITPEIARYIVQKNGFCIRYIPNELITEEIAWLAVRDGEYLDGNALCNIPDSMLTYEMCLAAVRCEEQTNCAIEWVPDRFHTYELSYEAVSHPGQNNGYALQFVKDEFKTKELCLKAVAVEPYAMKFVPPGLF